MYTHDLVPISWCLTLSNVKQQGSLQVLKSFSSSYTHREGEQIGEKPPLFIHPSSMSSSPSSLENSPNQPATHVLFFSGIIIIGEDVSNAKQASNGVLLLHDSSLVYTSWCPASPMSNNRSMAQPNPTQPKMLSLSLSLSFGGDLVVQQHG